MNSAIKPKWGGYTPTAAKDVNKHKIEKINRFIKETKKELKYREDISKQSIFVSESFGLSLFLF